jgi:hypothetical protein
VHPNNRHQDQPGVCDQRALDHHAERMAHITARRTIATPGSDGGGQSRAHLIAAPRPPDSCGTGAHEIAMYLSLGIENK